MANLILTETEFNVDRATALLRLRPAYGKPVERPCYWKNGMGCDLKVLGKRIAFPPSEVIDFVADAGLPQAYMRELEHRFGAAPDELAEHDPRGLAGLGEGEPFFELLEVACIAGRVFRDPRGYGLYDHISPEALDLAALEAYETRFELEREGIDSGYHDRARAIGVKLTKTGHKSHLWMLCGLDKRGTHNHNVQAVNLEYGWGGDARKSFVRNLLDVIEGNFHRYKEGIDPGIYSKIVEGWGPTRETLNIR